MHYYIYILALQRGQIRHETEKAETNTKKRYPVESPQEITVKRPWTSLTPHKASTKTASPLPVQKTNISRKHYIHLKLQPKCLFITSTK